MNTRRGLSIAVLTVLTSTLALGILSTPAFGWTIYSDSTCVGTSWSASCTVNPSYVIGSQISDTAKVSTTTDGGSAYITFSVYHAAAGACAGTGTALFTSGPTAISPGISTTTSAAWDSSGASAGNYVWTTHVTYSDATPKDSCEPFSLIAGQHPVPEFAFGSALLIALALPVLFVLKTKFAKTAAPKLP